MAIKPIAFLTLSLLSPLSDVKVPITEYVVYKKTSVHHLEINVRVYFQTAERWN